MTYFEYIKNIFRNILYMFKIYSHNELLEPY